jgi:hypothetical protein
MKNVFIWRLLVPPPAGGVAARPGMGEVAAKGGRKRYRSARSETGCREKRLLLYGSSIVSSNGSIV